MLKDAVKILGSDKEMAATLFARWVTMKTEQPSTEVSVAQPEFLTLLDTLFPALAAEFQGPALAI